MESIDKRSRKRARFVLRCLPFNQKFYSDVGVQGLDAETVFEKGSEYSFNIASWFNNENEVEAAFRWLINIGILRREVDGQGLTSRVRLTPLGRQIIEMNSGMPLQQANFLGKLIHWIYRNWPLR